MPTARRQRRSTDSVERPEPAGGLGEGHSLDQRDEDVRDVRLVAAQPAHLDAPAHPAHDQDPHRAGGGELLRPGREVGERPGEHDLGQLPIGPEEPAVRGGQRPQVGQRVLGLGQRRELGEEAPEALEVQLAHDPGLVAEELVERRGRRLGPGGQRSGREASGSPLGQQVHGGGQHLVAELGGALLATGHSAGPQRRERTRHLTGEPGV